MSPSSGQNGGSKPWGGRFSEATDPTVERFSASIHFDKVLARHGRIDLFCSNAGATAGGGVLTDAPNDAWQRQWDLHVMAHIYAARAVLPSMIERGEGYLLNTASAAGLLAAIGSGPYSVTKAAAIKFAEFVSIVHGDEGIRVSVLCPQGVNTAMAPRRLGDGQTDGIIEPEELATTVVETLLSLIHI